MSYDNLIVDVAFYTASSLMLIIFFLINLAFGNRAGLWYTLLIGLGLWLVACLDGTAAGLFWSEHPDLNTPLSLLSLLTLDGAGLLIAARHLSPNHKLYRLRTLMLILGGWSFFLIILIPMLPASILAMNANVLFICMLTAQAFTTYTWRPLAMEAASSSSRFNSKTSMVTTAILLTLVALLTVVALYLVTHGSMHPSRFNHLASKAVFLTAAIGIMASFLAHIVGLRVDHERALQQELEASRRAATASEEKLLAERRFARMREIALERKQQLAAASHDIRQPLVSLRLALDGLASAHGESVRIQFRDALSYIEGLADAYLMQSRKDADADMETQRQPISSRADDANQLEVLPINLLQQTITQMFSEEAGARGLQLSTVPCSASAWVNPLIVMRIVSNLVTNAIKHTDSGRILLGCRRLPEQLRIEVHDQGPGISSDEFARYKQRHVKGEASQGEGIGLSVCAELAEQAGYELGVRSGVRGGSCFYLLIPRHSQSSQRLR